MIDIADVRNLAEAARAIAIAQPAKNLMAMRDDNPAPFYLLPDRVKVDFALMRRLVRALESLCPDAFTHEEDLAAADWFPTLS